MYESLQEILKATRNGDGSFGYRRLKDRYDTAKMFEVIELSNTTLETPINVSHRHIRHQLDAIRLKV
jgi:hypothetical protein